MGKSVARMGDKTSHNGAIVTGSANVMIGGQPAASAGCQHLCPMFTGNVPHVGGVTGLDGCSTSVLVNGKPLALVGARAVCACGPPDNSIAAGASSVVAQG